MPNWIRKSFVVIVSILTFGLVTPFPTNVHNNDNDKKPRDERELPFSSEEIGIQSTFIEDDISDRDKFMSKMINHAESQSYLKFGSKIKPVIEDEFRQVILPNIEKVIEELTTNYPETDLSNLSVTESPTSGNGEKIFNIMNKGQDILRFHVRRDRPPQEGYWFNFHYHTYHDKFQTHYSLGEIYWDKNTPPKWMS